MAQVRKCSFDNIPKPHSVKRRDMMIRGFRFYLISRTLLSGYRTPRFLISRPKLFSIRTFRPATIPYGHTAHGAYPQQVNEMSHGCTAQRTRVRRIIFFARSSCDNTVMPCTRTLRFVFIYYFYFFFLHYKMICVVYYNNTLNRNNMYSTMYIYIKCL